MAQDKKRASRQALHGKLMFLVEVSGVAPLSASEITPASPSAATNYFLVQPSTSWPAKGGTSP